MAMRVEGSALGLHSEICSFGTLFGDSNYFTMPYLQRPYEWGIAEVADMVGDLLSASNGKYLNYFLGHIVGVRNDKAAIEIVDGQQRFITTTILYAYLRDRLSAHSPAIAERLQNCIMHGGRVRVAPRPSDAGFLKEWIQTPGNVAALTATYKKDDDTPYQAQSDAQTLMALAAQTVEGKLERLGLDALADLATFVLERAVVDFIIADNRTLAAILYRGMNMRGKKLSPADLIKLEAIEESGLKPELREAAARAWEQVEENLKSENFAFLLQILPLLVSRETTVRPGDLAEWCKHAFKFVDPETLLMQHLPVYADVYAELLTGDVRCECKSREDEQALATVNRMLKGMLLLEEKHWIAPAISAVHASRARPQLLAYIFRGLDRLSFAGFFDAVRHEERAARFARILRAGSDETQLAEAFALKSGELAKMVRRLNEPFGRHNWRRRALAARINASFPNGYSFHDSEDVTVEHILPTSQSAAWLAAGWTPATVAACAELIGNYVLLTFDQNNKANQKLFADKQKIYYETPKAPIHPITEDVRRADAWTERHIRERTERLIRLLVASWDID